MERSEQALKLSAQLDTVSDVTGTDGQDETFDPRVILKVSAATRLADGPLSSLDLRVLGEGRNWTYVVLSNSASRRLLRQVLDEYSRTVQNQLGWDRPANLAAMIDNIDGIELYRPDDRLDPELGQLDFAPTEIVDIVVWPSRDQAEANARISEVNDLLIQNTQAGQAAEIVAIDNRPQTTVIRSRLDRVSLQALANLGWVERLKPQATATTTFGELSRAQVTQALPPPEGAAIGILDGLAVQANPLLAGRVSASAEFPGPPHTFDGRDADHGTGVTSIASWGSLEFIVDGSSPPTSAPVVCARVLDFDPRRNKLIVPGQTHVTLEAAIRWTVAQGVRIINLSMNRDFPRDSILRDEVTATLDDLIRELDVVLVVSAGNRVAPYGTDWHTGYPGYLSDVENQVTEPADAALAVTVGAFALKDTPSSEPVQDKTAVAPAGNTSPFSRTGPVLDHTREGSAKPEFGANGGNMVHDHRSGVSTESDAGVAVLVATPPIGGQIVTADSGTSFSAPSVAHEIGRIATRYPSASANRLRALTALSARRPSGEIDFADFDRFNGSIYGSVDASRVLESERNTAILAVDDSIECDTTVLHKLPVPYDFARGEVVEVLG